MTNVRKKGVKATMVDLNVCESHLFPRNKYSTLRNMLHIARVECPGRDWSLDIVEDGILVTCVK